MVGGFLDGCSSFLSSDMQHTFLPIANATATADNTVPVAAGLKSVKFAEDKKKTPLVLKLIPVHVWYYFWKGFIAQVEGLSSHGAFVWFKNMKIPKLDMWS